MNRWLHKFMEKPDISDKFDLLDKKMENMHGVGPDKTDRFDLSANMSGSLIAPMSRDVSFFFSQSFQKDRIL